MKNSATRNNSSEHAVDKKPRKPRVFVGMSGGVDSSVAALLLLRAGYEVTGAFIKTWHPDWLPCPWRDERRDAMRVAARLGIPFITIDAVEEYRTAVAEAMIAGYACGETPNPDILCNREVKFGIFWKKAYELGADYIATGHYAQNIKVEGRVVTDIPEFHLSASTDTNKDQSYFLWTLTADDLSHTLFPVGHLAKPEVRAIAAEADLPVHDKKDSQGICFLGDVDMEEFLRHYCALSEGPALDVATGKRLGTHKGALIYTIGQRHGFTIDSVDTARNPYYVVAKDMEKNTLWVGQKAPDGLLPGAQSEITLKNVSLVNISAESCIKNREENDTPILCRIRYRQELFPVTYSKSAVDATGNETLTFKLKDKQFFDAGQSAVLYCEKVINGKKYIECLGGGILAPYDK